jgi:hypothetical protein
MQRNIISGNGQPSSPDIRIERQPNDVLRIQYNLTDAVAWIPGDDETGNRVDPDPKLFSLADNGGDTLTHAIRRGSKAISIYPGTAAGNSYDQRAVDPFLRPLGRLDAGAIEYVPGDINQDQGFNCIDVNELSRAIAMRSTNDLYNIDENYDAAGSPIVDIADLLAWLKFAGGIHLLSGRPYLQADANLDGSVDGVDFIIWNTNKFTSNRGFCEGDFNADGNVDGEDFVIWNTYKFQISGRPGSGDAPSYDVALAAYGLKNQADFSGRKGTPAPQSSEPMGTATNKSPMILVLESTSANRTRFGLGSSLTVFGRSAFGGAHAQDDAWMRWTRSLDEVFTATDSPENRMMASPLASAVVETT